MESVKRTAVVGHGVLGRCRTILSGQQGKHLGEGRASEAPGHTDYGILIPAVSPKEEIVEQATSDRPLASTARDGTPAVHEGANLASAG